MALALRAYRSRRVHEHTRCQVMLPPPSIRPWNPKSLFHIYLNILESEPLSSARSDSVQRTLSIGVAEVRSSATLAGFELGSFWPVVWTITTADSPLCLGDLVPEGFVGAVARALVPRRRMWVALGLLGLLSAGLARGEQIEFPVLPAECGSETRGTVDIAGCPVFDKLIDRTPLDARRQAFELWCIDRGLLGLRFVQENEAGQVIREHWVGACPYMFAENRCTLERHDGRWVGGVYRSTDTQDDDKDGKVDRVRFTFRVEPGELRGQHDNDGVVDVTRFWRREAGEARIPGDPATTSDGPVLLLKSLPAGGNLALLTSVCRLDYPGDVQSRVESDQRASRGECEAGRPAGERLRVLM